MKTTTCILFSLILTLFLVACDSGGSDEELPTRVQDSAITTEEAEAENTATPTATPLQERPTLPPSWTPQPTSTDPPPLPTETPIPTADLINEPPECASFGPDTRSTDEIIQLGDSPTVAWRPVEGAELYRLVVLDDNGNQVFEELTEETTFTIPSTVFVAAVRYGWEVRPLDSVGTQICRGRGGLLDVRP